MNTDLPLGFRFSGHACGIKQSTNTLDLAMFASDPPSAAAGVYTRNRIRSASVNRNERLTPSRSIRAVVINSGNANACTGQRGISDNQSIADITAGSLDCSADQVLVLSTGIIGEFLPMDRLTTGIPQAVDALATGHDAFDRAAHAMMTTDQFAKMVHRRARIGNTPVNICGAAKGAGMIRPDMATMLAIFMTDAALDSATLDRLLRTSVNKSFNRISVDGHMSTSDSVLLLANGQAGNSAPGSDELEEFQTILNEAMVELARMIPSDGEGASHLITIEVHGARSIEDADAVARTIGDSPLVKTAVTGADPNWGRIISAVGYAGVPVEAEKLRLLLNGTPIFAEGGPLEFDAGELSQAMRDQFECVIQLDLGVGSARTHFWASDLTVDYVNLNAEYHT